MNTKISKYTLFAIGINIILFLFGIVKNVNILYIVSINIYVFMMLNCYKKIEQRSLLFAFGIAFFTFLLGRDFLELFLNYKVENYYTQEINNHTYLCFIVSLVGVWISYLFFEHENFKKINFIAQDIKIKTNNLFIVCVRKVSKYIFYFSIPFALINKIVISIFIRTYSYAEYYIKFSKFLHTNKLLYVISKIELIMPVALCIIFSTLPTKKEVKVPIICYIVYLIISLGAGNRGPFVLGILLLFIFIVYMQGYRPEEAWFDRKKMVLFISIVPIIAVGGTIYNVMRFGMSINNISFINAFIDFFYDQGVTITVIKKAYEFEEQIPKQGFYLLEFFHSGIWARILGIPVYHGNSIEHALYGGSFTHAIAYTVMQQSYLSGLGTGTSYIAELYYDFNYLGVFIGNVIYGWIFSKINKTRTNKLFIRALVFVLITQFLWSPRGSYTAFLSFVFAPSTIITFISIFGIAKLISDKQKRFIKSIK